MTSPTTSAPAEGDILFDSWFDPIESGLRTRVRGFIETLLEEELTAALSRPRYGRRAKEPTGAEPGSRVPGHRHGHRTRQLTGSFGPTTIAVPRARLVTPSAALCFGPGAASSSRPTSSTLSTLGSLRA